MKRLYNFQLAQFKHHLRIIVRTLRPAHSPRDPSSAYNRIGKKKRATSINGNELK